MDLKSLLPSLLTGKKKPKRPMRRHVRHNCIIVATMMLVDKGVSVDGLVTELSLGGVKFRPATTYILDRTGDEVSISMDGFVIAGTIRATLASGYGIQLQMELEEEDLEAFSKYFKRLDEFGAAAAA